MGLDQIILVDERKIARTYPDGVEDYDAYQKALALNSINSKMSHKEIAKIVDRNEITVRFWLKGRKAGGMYKKSKPECMRGIIKLNDEGLLPLKYNHKKFSYVNLLYSLAFWGGFSGKNMLAITQKESYEGFDDILKGLNLNVRERSQRKNVRDISDGAAAINRLFKGMSLPPEATDNDYLVSDSLGTRENPMKKSRLELILPYYLSPLVYYDLNAGDKELANRILYDFVSVLFSRKTYKTEGSNSLEHSLLTSKNRYIAERLAYETEVLIRKVIPDFPYHYKVEDKRIKGHTVLRMFFKIKDFPDPTVFRFNSRLKELYNK